MAAQDYDTTSSTDTYEDQDHEARPNHGIDHNNSGDPTKGGVLGAVGGAVVGALAGGPIGAVIGAIAGGAASAAGVAAVDHVDHDSSPNETTNNSRATGTTDTAYTAPVAADTTADYDSSYVAPSALGVRTTGVADGTTVIPVVEEELAVGTRAVETGGARIVTRVSETPVQENVTLHEEHVSVDRRPVDRAVTDADNAFREQDLEVTAMGEEAVVAKNARVVEEVVVGKTATDRIETISDTVRRTDVDVEELDRNTTAGTTSGRY